MLADSTMNTDRFKVIKFKLIISIDWNVKHPPPLGQEKLLNYSLELIIWI